MIELLASAGSVTVGFAGFGYLALALTNDRSRP